MTPAVFGGGSPGDRLSPSDVGTILEAAFAEVPAGARVLAIVPDRTRDDTTHQILPLASEVLRRRGTARLDVLVAQGTHPPMSDGDVRTKIGATGAGIAGVGGIFPHRWDDDRSLVTLGTIAAGEIAALTGGLLAEAVPVRINALLAPGSYDVVLAIGATMPHEVAGFAGGAKYFFPGVAGPELTHLTHWLGALATIERVIGRVETPTRRVIEAAADLVPARVIGITSVVERCGTALETRALFAGDVREAFRRAAAISRQVHVRYTGRQYTRVVALLDRHYEELWVGGKASYKLGAIVEDGGELLIHAPHLTAISATHGRLIERYGYAPLEDVRDMVEGSDELRANLCVAAHLAHVSYGSRVANGRVVPRFRITLASNVTADTCARVRLGYADWQAVDLDACRADPDTLVVEHAGRDLYLVDEQGA